MVLKCIRGRDQNLRKIYKHNSPKFINHIDILPVLFCMKIRQVKLYVYKYIHRMTQTNKSSGNSSKFRKSQKDSAELRRSLRRGWEESQFPEGMKEKSQPRKANKVNITSTDERAKPPEE